jgi:DNA polymerase I-like protein with 3'-5' exonuclease and polymerase domains
MLFAIDTESTYAKGRDIRSLGVRRYVEHPETLHYLVSLYGHDLAAVAEPKDFPWYMLKGATLLSHNKSYDETVITELRRRGLDIPEPAAWHCTADLAAYRQSPRALADASREILGIELDKSRRDDMKGRQWTDLSVSERVAMAEYCLLDSKACYYLWGAESRNWPDHEVATSDHTAMMCRRGIGVDLERIRVGLEKLAQVKFAAAERIPWAGTSNEKGDEIAVTSPKQIALECQRRGIPPPESTDSKSEEFEEWLDLHEAQADFIQAIQTYRKANRLHSVLASMRDRQVGGRLHYGLKYFGATHTGRWSGDAGLNLQNFPRKPFEDVDARACLVPAPGKVFLIADLAQIEARVTCWLADDEVTMQMLRQGIDLYEAHARRTMGYTDSRPLKEANNDMRQFAKCRVLALGFGLGAGKFQRIVKLWTGMDISAERARQMVADFRQTNRGITRLWSKLEEVLKASRGDTFHLALPSGRAIRYFDVAEAGGKMTGRVELGGHRKNLYGGLLTENLVQATARDLFAEAILRIERAGLPVVLHVHDEVVCEVDEASAEEAARELRRLMLTPPDWADGLPIETSVEIAKEYGK